MQSSLKKTRPIHPSPAFGVETDVYLVLMAIGIGGSIGRALPQQRVWNGAIEHNDRNGRLRLLADHPVHSERVHEALLPATVAVALWLCRRENTRTSRQQPVQDRRE